MSASPAARRTAVVTGASSGIGEATARALAAGGFDLALLARRGERIERLAGELGGGGTTALAIEADVTDPDSVTAAAREVAERLGGAEVLVNNAGQMLPGAFGHERAEETRRMVETNLIGTMTVTAAFLEQLRERHGDIVNVSSISGRKSDPLFAVYNATKFGMNGWSEALRQELAPDVRVILIEPGVVNTELLEHGSDESLKGSLEQWYEQVGALAPADVGAVIAHAVGLPHHVSLSEIVVRATNQT